LSLSIFVKLARILNEVDELDNSNNKLYLHDHKYIQYRQYRKSARRLADPKLLIISFLNTNNHSNNVWNFLLILMFGHPIVVGFLPYNTSY